MTEYTYSKGMIKRIIEAYPDIYGGIPVLETDKHINPVWFAVYLLLKVIAGEEPSYQECLEIFQFSGNITDQFSIAEHKADFDMSLREIGRGNWQGELDPVFRNYNYYGRLQRIIIAQMLNVEESYLERLGFTDIPRLRGTAYSRIAEYLNGGV